DGVGLAVVLTEQTPQAEDIRRQGHVRVGRWMLTPQRVLQVLQGHEGVALEEETDKDRTRFGGGKDGVLAVGDDGGGTQYFESVFHAEGTPCLVGVGGFVSSDLTHSDFS